MKLHMVTGFSIKHWLRFNILSTYFSCMVFYLFAKIMRERDILPSYVYPLLWNYEAIDSRRDSINITFELSNIFLQAIYFRHRLVKDSVL